MAQGPQTLSNADDVLQFVYLPVVREQINQKAILLFGYTPEELSKGFGTANASKGETLDYRGISRDASKVEFAGRKWVFSSHTRRNEGGTAYSEDGLLPKPSRQGWTDFEDRIKYFAKQFEITGISMEVTERSVGSYVNLLTEETEGTINDARWDLNRQAYGDGTGTLATMTADPGANQLTLDTVQYIRVGMIVDIVDPADDSLDATEREITAINNLTVTYSGADITPPANAKVCVTGNWKKEINGLTNIIGPDGSAYTTLHNVDGSLAANSFWKGKVKDAAGASFDEDLAQTLLDEIGAEGWETEIIITTRGIRRRYVNQLKAQKRFNDAMSGKLHGGFKFIDFNDYPLIYDDVCPKKNAFFLRPMDFLWIWLGANDFRWLRRDGKILRMVTGGTGQDKDNWRATLYRYNDLGCFRRKTQGRMKNLADDQATSLS